MKAVHMRVRPSGFSFLSDLRGPPFTFHEKVGPLRPLQCPPLRQQSALHETTMDIKHFISSRSLLFSVYTSVCHSEFYKP